MNEPSLETKVAVQATEIARLRKQQDDLETEVKELRRLDTSRMRAGVVILGGMVLSLAGYIFHIVTGAPRP